MATSGRDSVDASSPDRRTVNLAPLPAPALLAFTVPPCSSQRWRTMPMTMPMAMPRPRQPWARVASRTNPPRGVNFTALEKRFQSNYWMRSSSAMMVPTPSSVGPVKRRSLPLTMGETSRMSAVADGRTLPVRVDEHRDLRTENIGVEGLVEELDGPACVAFGEGVARPSRSRREAVELRQSPRVRRSPPPRRRSSHGPGARRAARKWPPAPSGSAEDRRPAGCSPPGPKRPRGDGHSIAMRSKAWVCRGFAPRMPLSVSFAPAAAGSTRASTQR